MRKTKMTPKAARRIQSHADKSGKNQGFKNRAQKAAAKNKKLGNNNSRFNLSNTKLIFL